MSKRIAIIGAGIGGLTLGIELQRRGLDVQLYEQTPVLREVGAAVSLSANATRFYDQRFGLAEPLGPSPRRWTG
ncbi:NAD(P)-binding protein [Kocuria sp. 2SI]|uniref:NAD(P)-binding protein n=1 Tax=Kocuria sp. 2SI TaxID=2502203 RepID=UPI0010F6C308|nr:NAD(P)-binding protein [Kocuria sp. 2SI]